MHKLHEETNQRISTMFSANDIELATLKALSKEATDVAALTDLGNKCHAALVQLLWQVDPVINLNGIDYMINISRGGGAFQNQPRTNTAKTFNPYRDISITLYLEPVDFTTDGSGKFMSLVDILEGTVRITEPADNTLLNDITAIIECYHYAFDRVHFGADVATKRETDRAKAIARRQEEEELKQALDIGDFETANRIAEAQHARQEEAEVTAVNKAKSLGSEAIKQAKEIRQPEVTDIPSFVYGWLASNVEYLYAKLPGWNKFAEGDFLRHYPGVTKVDTVGKPGYWVNDPIKKTSGGYKYQLYSEYHVHFKHGVAQKAPECVKAFLDCFTSRKTGTASIFKGDTASKALARYLIADLGFWFDRTENTEAYRTCKLMANNKEDFELGYSWVENQRKLDAEKRRTARRVTKSTPAETDTFDPEVEAEVNPLGLDFPDSEV